LSPNNELNRFDFLLSFGSSSFRVVPFFLSIPLPPSSLFIPCFGGFVDFLVVPDDGDGDGDDDPGDGGPADCDDSRDEEILDAGIGVGGDREDVGDEITKPDDNEVEESERDEDLRCVRRCAAAACADEILLPPVGGG